MPGTTGVAFANRNNTIQIAPNPATDHIDITATSQFTPNTFISVFDRSGRCIYRAPAELQNELTINTSTWIDGLYMVTILNDEGIVKKEKIVISK